MPIVWILRVVLLALFLPLAIPFHALAGAFVFAPIPMALLVLALALMALAVVLGLILGVLATLVDVVIVLILIGIAWKWPRGIRAPFQTKLRLAYRSLRNTFGQELRRCSTTDVALCLSVVLIAITLSLSSGFLQFVLTVAVVLALVGVVWKWPRSPHLPVLRKLQLALRAVWDDLRKRFRH